MGRSKPQRPARNAGQKRTAVPLHYDRVHWLTAYVPGTSRQDEPEAHAAPGASAAVRPRASTTPEARRSKRVRTKTRLDLPEIGRSVTVESAFRDALRGHLPARSGSDAGAEMSGARRTSSGRGPGYTLGSSVRDAGRFAGARAIEGDVAYEQQNGVVTDGTGSPRATASAGAGPATVVSTATAKAAGQKQASQRDRKRTAPCVPRVLSFSAELRLRGQSDEPPRAVAPVQRDARTFLMSSRALDLAPHFHSAALRHCSCASIDGTSFNHHSADEAASASALSMSASASSLSATAIPVEPTAAAAARTSAWMV